MTQIQQRTVVVTIIVYKYRVRKNIIPGGNTIISNSMTNEFYTKLKLMKN